MTTEERIAALFNAARDLEREAASIKNDRSASPVDRNAADDMLRVARDMRAQMARLKG